MNEEKAKEAIGYSDPPHDYYTTGNGYLQHSSYLNNSRLWKTREGAERYAKRGEFLYKVTVTLIGRAPRDYPETEQEPDDANQT